MEATRPDAAPRISHVQPFDKERKASLTEVLTSMSVTIIEELQKVVKLLSSVMDLCPDDGLSEYEAAIEGIVDSSIIWT